MKIKNRLNKKRHQHTIEKQCYKDGKLQLEYSLLNGIMDGIQSHYHTNGNKCREWFEGEYTSYIFKEWHFRGNRSELHQVKKDVGIHGVSIKFVRSW